MTSTQRTLTLGGAFIVLASLYPFAVAQDATHVAFRPDRKILIEFNGKMFEGVRASTKEPKFRKVLQDDLNEVSKQLKLPRSIEIANMSRFSNIGAVWYRGATSEELRLIYSAVRARPYVKAANFDGRNP